MRNSSWLLATLIRTLMFKNFGFFKESEAFGMSFTLDRKFIKDIISIFEHFHTARSKFIPLLKAHEYLCITHEDQAVSSL